MFAIDTLLQDVNENPPSLSQCTERLLYPIKEMLTSSVNYIGEDKVILSVIMTTELLGMSLRFLQKQFLYWQT